MSRLDFMRRWVRAGVLAAALASIATAGQLQTGPGLHSAMPAGYVVVRLLPSGANVAVLGLIECPQMEGARHVSEGLNSKIVAADGMPLKHFPRQFSFRVTVSLRKTLLEGPSDSVATAEDPEQFLLKLGFKLKIYHGLEMHEIDPQSVKMIGVPADVPYDERVFRVSFEVENLPVSDRVVLLVLSPEEEPVTHFSFGLL
ncbi:MAG TPA: hypothetical protein VI488_03310 [Candidatus Angelobacter sp.]